MKNFLTRLAIAHLKRRLKAEPDYAWAWQCNLAMAFCDHAGVVADGTKRHEVANRGAALFMSRLFGVNVTTGPEWAKFKEQWK